MRKLLVAINLLLVLLILGLAFYWQPESATGAKVPAAANSADFTLNGPRGEVSLRDFSGKIVLLTFGYTFCPDICPTTLSIWAQALGSLAPQELERVQPIFVSIDPERDTPARLAEYTAFFHPAILGLTGTPERLQEITARYGAAFSRQENASAGGYVVDHTALSYLLDQEGRLLEQIAHATPPDQLLAGLRKHLSFP